MWFGDVGLAQECGSLTEQSSECVSAAFCENAINDFVRQWAPRRIEQTVTLQVLIIRISKTRQRKRQQIHDTNDKGEHSNGEQNPQNKDRGTNWFEEKSDSAK